VPLTALLLPGLLSGCCLALSALVHCAGRAAQL